MPEPIFPDGDFTAADWLEAVDAPHGMGEDIFSRESSEAKIVVQIPFAKVKGAKRFALGYAWTDDVGSPGFLFRLNPLPHPRHDELRAASVHIRPFIPLARDVAESGDPDYRGWDQSEHLDLPVRKWANFSQALMLVKFGQLPYVCLEDDDNPDDWEIEFERNIDDTHEVAGEAQLLSAQTGRAIKFVEGPVGDPNGKEYQGEIGEYVSRLNLSWAWYDVPREYVITPQGLPQKLLNCLGRVNSVEIGGHPPGTLLMLGFRMQKFMYPYRNEGRRPLFGYNVFLHFSQFDPQPAVELLSPPETPLFRGHNLMPWASSTAGSIWYAATRGGGAGDPRYIAEADYFQMFTHVLAP